MNCKNLLIKSKHLQKFCPSGVYILPQFDDIKGNYLLIVVWHGVLFIREGFYKDGIFKFEINIPSSYPAKAPEVKFVSKVLHPLIDNKTGVLDISKKFPTWEAGKNFIVKVIYFIHEIFYNSVYLQETDSLNSDIAKLYITNPKNLENEITKLSKLSFEKRFETKNPNSSLKFSEFNNYHSLILDKILKQNKDVNTYDRIEDFKNWFMNNFMEIIQSSEMQNYDLNHLQKINNK